MATKMEQVGKTEGYVHRTVILGRPCSQQIIEGWKKTFSYGKVGRLHTSHSARSWKTMSFWLGAEGEEA